MPILIAYWLTSGFNILSIVMFSNLRYSLNNKNDDGWPVGSGWFVILVGVNLLQAELLLLQSDGMYAKKHVKHSWHSVWSHELWYFNNPIVLLVTEFLTYLFGLGKPMGVRLLSGLGTVFRMRIWDTLLERWHGWVPTLASYRPPYRTK